MSKKRSVFFHLFSLLTHLNQDTNRTMRLLSFSVLIVYASAIDNGYGMLPPMGWRSWNCYGDTLNQTVVEAVMEKMAARVHRGDTALLSLADLGFSSVGVDDGWEACGAGVNGSFHDAAGNPMINTTSFPDMGSLVRKGHDLGLRVGWYMDNCLCRELNFTDPTYISEHMKRSVESLVAYGFDGLKLDGCGQFRNLTWWAKLLNETGRAVMIENCHWGDTVPGQTSGDGPCAGDAGVSDCPYNFYRTSTDIKPVWHMMISNLLSTLPYLGSPPLSRPGGWAYPDMLEVGNFDTYEEDRAHFAAWCIISSPLILGYDVTDDSITDKIWSIVSNKEILEVSQTWAGHPGRLVKSYDPTGGSVNESMMVWGKVLGAHDQAALIIGNYEGTVNYTVEVDLTEFGFAAGDSVKVRDLYAKKDIMTAKGSFQTEAVASHDSRMYRFTQVTDEVDLQEVEA